jgi:spermidine/putrescine transport system substrate-binding protein
MGRNQDEVNVLGPSIVAEQVTRRRLLTTGAGAAMSLYLAACGNGGSSSSGGAAETVRASAPIEKNLLMANWADYVNPRNVAAFERETGVKVTSDSYGSNDELLAKLNAGGANYDIVVPNGPTTQIMIERDLATKLNLELIPNHRNILPSYLDAPFDPGRRYSIPKDVGITGFYYRTAVIRERPETLMEMMDLLPKYPDARVNFVDDPNQVIESMLVTLELDINTTDQADIDKARDLLARAKPYIDTFNSDYVARASAGQIDIGLGYNSDTARIIEARAKKGDEVRFLLSKTTADYWIDNWAIPSGARNPVAAHAWLNYTLDPRVAGLEAQYTQHQAPVIGADRYSGDIADDPIINVSDELFSRYQTRSITDPRQLAARARAYSEVKAS